MNSIQYMTTFCVYIFFPFSQSSYLMAAVYSLNLVYDDKRDGKRKWQWFIGRNRIFCEFLANDYLGPFCKDNFLLTTTTNFAESIHQSNRKSVKQFLVPYPLVIQSLKVVALVSYTLFIKIPCQRADNRRFKVAFFSAAHRCVTTTQLFMSFSLSEPPHSIDNIAIVNSGRKREYTELQRLPINCWLTSENDEIIEYI